MLRQQVYTKDWDQSEKLGINAIVELGNGSSELEHVVPSAYRWSLDSDIANNSHH